MFDAFEPGGAKHALLTTALSAAVPLIVLEFQANGGPDADDFAGCKGNSLARGLAIMSYCPGGVRVFGLHFETKSTPP